MDSMLQISTPHPKLGQVRDNCSQGNKSAIEPDLAEMLLQTPPYVVDD